MRIKQVPEDFTVEEIIKLETKPEGNQIYFWLTKRNWTTEAAIGEIARKLGISYRRLKFAGSKDKVAVTKQAVSAFKVPAERLLNLRIKDIEIEIIGNGENPISLGSLEGNYFEIVIRDLIRADVERLKKNLPKIKKSGFKNFFGEQRFGKGNTHLIGKAILQGRPDLAVKEMVCFPGEEEREEVKSAKKFAAENWGEWQAILEKLPRHLHLEKSVLIWLTKNKNDFAGALRTLPKHIRKLYIHAYQSWLWNSALAKVKAVKGNLQIPGFATKLNKDTFSREIKKLLEKDNLTLDSFRCARMPELAVEGELRKAVIVPKGLVASSAEKDELNAGKSKVLLKFSLSKGVYATTFVEALFKGKE